MKKKTIQSKIIYFGVTFCLLASMAIFGSAKGAPTPIQPSGPRYGGTLRVAEQIDGVSIGYPPKMVRAASNRQVSSRH